MRWIGGDQGIFAIAALAALGAVLLAHAYGCTRIRAASAVCALVCAALPLANRDRALIDVRSHTTQLPGVTDWVRNDREVRREWNELSRLGFFETRGDSAIYVRIDSGCQTTIPSQDPQRRREFVEHTTFERLPHVLDRHRRYLEIGAGGGRGMVLAQASGSERVIGVEINPDIVAASLSGFPGYGVGAPFADANNQLLAAEGRSYARNCRERFDTVTITFIQTGVASSSAAFALSEANLFTVEAFAEFIALLDDEGLFYVYRNGGNELLRLIAMAREALSRFGITDVREHLFAAMNPDGQAALLVSRSPLSAAEIARLEGECSKLGIQALYSPAWRSGARPPNPFPARVRELRASGELAMRDVVREYKALIHDPRFETIEQTFVTCTDPQAFVDEYPVDIAAPRDDRPYYFFQGLSKWSDFALYFDLDGTGILGGTVMLLFWMAAAFTVLVALLILLPLALRRGTRSVGARGLAVLAYFSGLGLGYIAVQISCIQRFTLFLGHPVYALSVVLLAFLVSSGLGAAWSERWFKSGRVTLGRAMAVLVVLLLVYNQLLPVVFHSAAMGWPVLARVALSIALIFPLAFVMGFFFPHGIRTVDRAAPQLIPWAWGANSATSVLGSILALVLAIHFGFAVVGACAAALYAILCLPSGWALERWSRAAGG
jgi:spermidine synthase